jgi:hypothetical protein
MAYEEGSKAHAMVLKVLRRLKAEEGHLKNDSISNNSEKHG